MKIVKDINSSTRVRHFDIVFYGSSEELLKIIHTYRERIQRYAFIFHDKDVYDEDIKDSVSGEYIHRKGDIKVNHYHVIVSMYNACTLSACCKLFTTEADKPRVYSVGDMVLCYEYLIHKNHPDKYQYRKCDIISDDLYYFEKLTIQGDKPDNDNKAEQIVMDLLAGVPTRIMVSRYGRDFIIHRPQYVDCANAIRTEDFYLDNKRKEAEAFERSRLERLSEPQQQQFDFDNNVGD